MPKVVCNYGLHFSEMAGKFQETVELKGNLLKDLVRLLEERYGRFEEEMIHPGTGELLTRNAILIERGDENTGVLFSSNSELRDGDILTFF
jgi:hypothetical protein